MTNTVADQQRSVDRLLSHFWGISLYHISQDIHQVSVLGVSSPPAVNGIMFRKRQFVICKTDVAFWHVASVGTPAEFLSVYFTGNLFQHQGLYQSVLTLFPMSGLTVSMESEVVGKRESLKCSQSLEKSNQSFLKYVCAICGFSLNPACGNLSS